MIPFSILDLSPINEGSNAAQSFRNTLDLAQHGERWGFHRFWLAEHHGAPAVASAATSVLICHVANGTTNIRVGAGGIMLPNHSPLMIAEQFGTLESLFPGRIDLGLGRWPGTGGATARALRRNPTFDAAEHFPQDVAELLGYFAGTSEVQAVPGSGLQVPVWILGSGLFGAQLAASMGLPYAFASHFAPAQMMQSIEVYRSTFRPSAALDRPYVMLGFNVFAGDTDDEGAYHASSAQQAFVDLHKGRLSKLPPPIENYRQRIGPDDNAVIDQILACSAIGSPDKVAQQIKAFIERTGADELIITSQTFDHAARLKSFEIAASVRQAM